MKKFLAGLLFVLSFAISASAQSNSTPITVGQVNCGATALPLLNCYSVPLTIGGVSGTAWIDAQWNGGFIIFRPALEGANYVIAKVTSATALSRNNLGQVTSATITYEVIGDPDNDGDSDTVIGSITINATYYHGCNSGRGGGCRWVANITGGSGAQSITQD